MKSSTQANKTRKGPSIVWLYLLFGVILLALLVWSSLRTLRETPSRQSSIQLPGQGWVTLTLTTDPYPPLPSGSVRLQVMAENNQGVPVSFGSQLPYRVGSRGSEETLESGSLVSSPGGYQGSLQFPTPGDYWLDFEVAQGQKVRFQVYVEPAQ